MRRVCFVGSKGSNEGFTRVAKQIRGVLLGQEPPELPIKQTGGRGGPRGVNPTTKVAHRSGETAPAHAREAAPGGCAVPSSRPHRDHTAECIATFKALTTPGSGRVSITPGITALPAARISGLDQRERCPAGGSLVPSPYLRLARRFTGNQRMQLVAVTKNRPGRGKCRACLVGDLVGDRSQLPAALNWLTMSREILPRFETSIPLASAQARTA